MKGRWITRTVVLAWLGALLCAGTGVAQEPLLSPGSEYEVFLTNQTSAAKEVIVEPVGFIFNDVFEYSLRSSASKPQAANQWITGDIVPVAAGQIGEIVDHIATSTPLNETRHIGYGLYKMTVTGWGAIYLDYTDSDYPNRDGSYTENGLIADLFFLLKANNTLFWTNEDGSSEVQLSPGQVVRIWDQTAVGLGSKDRNVSGFIIPQSVTTIPLDGTGSLPELVHHNPGELRVEVEVQGDITVAQGKTFAPEPPAKLFFATGKKLSVDGSLVAAGSASNLIVFDRQGSSGTWGGIVFNSAVEKPRIEIRG